MLVVLLGMAACAASTESEGRGPDDELESALNPSNLAQALQKAGGGRYMATTTQEISPPAGSGGGGGEAITTNTRLFMDRIGHYRLVESNDQDGGRDVVLHTSPAAGRQLAVALRYGKMVRRPAHEPEPTRMLEEALGGPWMAWEVARRFADIKRQEDPTSTPPTVVFTLTKAAVPRSVRGGFESSSPLRKWRETIAMQTLRGEVRLEKTTGISDRCPHRSPLHPAPGRGSPYRTDPGRSHPARPGQGAPDLASTDRGASRPPANHT